MPIPDSAEKFCAQQLTRRAARMAADLRRLAERVEQEASQADRVPSPGLASYASIAANIQHQIMNALPNLQLNALTTLAQDADAARMQPERHQAPEF